MRKRIHSDSGQSLIEFAMLFPLMFLLVVNVVNFGGLFYAYITVANAARAGAAYMSMGPASANAPVLPSTAVVKAVVTEDLSTLNYSSSAATVNVCSNNNGKFQAPEACYPPKDPNTSATFVDPQPTTAVLGTVQVQYIYCPFIPSWNYPALGLFSTLPSCTIAAGKVTGGGVTLNRVAVMRIMQ